MARWGHYSQNWAGPYDRSNFTHPIQFHSSKEDPDHNVQKQPRSSLGGLVRFGPNASGPEASQCARIIWAWFLKNATAHGPAKFLLFTWMHSCTDGPDHIIVQNWPRSSLVLADCVRFWPNGSSPEASWCARIIGTASGQCFWAGLYWILIRSCRLNQTNGLFYQICEIISN